MLAESISIYQTLLSSERNSGMRMHAGVDNASSRSRSSSFPEASPYNPRSEDMTTTAPPSTGATLDPLSAGFETNRQSFSSSGDEKKRKKKKRDYSGDRSSSRNLSRSGRRGVSSSTQREAGPVLSREAADASDDLTRGSHEGGRRRDKKGKGGERREENKKTKDKGVTAEDWGAGWLDDGLETTDDFFSGSRGGEDPEDDEEEEEMGGWAGSIADSKVRYDSEETGEEHSFDEDKHTDKHGE